MIFEANELSKEIQKLNHWGASATVSTYVKAYNDFSTGLEYLRGIISEVEILNGWDKCIKKFGKDSDFDKESVEEQIKTHKKLLYQYNDDFKEFVIKRREERWG